MRFYLDLFMTFFRIGLFTLGGGYAMLPLIEREVVDRKRWIGADDFLDVLAIAQSLPGPIAVNTAVFVGYKTRGVPGCLVGLLGTVLPSFLCMLVVVAFLVGVRDNPVVAAVFTGIRPAVAALIAAAVWSLGAKAKLTPLTAGLALAAALAVWLGGVSPAWVVAAVALAGAMFPLSRKGGGTAPAVDAGGVGDGTGDGAGGGTGVDADGGKDQ